MVLSTWVSTSVVKNKKKSMCRGTRAPTIIYIHQSERGGARERDMIFLGELTTGGQDFFLTTLSLDDSRGGILGEGAWLGLFMCWEKGMGGGEGAWLGLALA